MDKSKNYGMNTRALHTTRRFKPVTGDIMAPLHLSTTYEHEVPGDSEYFYSRINNPTREIFERTLASLEGIEDYENLHALAMASGMSAVSLIELPALMTHDKAQGTEASVPDDLIRISVGLENIEDLIEDMDSALDAAKK